jgi:hypothetical protein
MARRRQVTSRSHRSLSHESALDAVEALRGMTPAKRERAFAELKPRIVAGILRDLASSSASAARKMKYADRIADLYLRHAEGKTSFLPLRAPRAAKIDDYRGDNE